MAICGGCFVEQSITEFILSHHANAIHEVVDETKGKFGVLRKLNHKLAEIILGTVLQLILGSPTMLPAVDVQSWLRVGGAVAVAGEDEVTEEDKNDENEFSDEQKKDEQDDS
ncbi:Sec-independent protein translocase protein TatB [Striga asiatica]|uniref:Sec-independent protein translocase protein TatB n=1 Tax=Striga asiatica TaxID=4170 RepID=A0A5A7R5A2_STRAF|nr:Sec-independent protein translocase protein TatB [Striga asiatica]